MKLFRIWNKGDAMASMELIRFRPYICPFLTPFAIGGVVANKYYFGGIFHIIIYRLLQVPEFQYMHCGQKIGKHVLTSIFNLSVMWNLIMTLSRQLFKMLFCCLCCRACDQVKGSHLCYLPVQCLRYWPKCSCLCWVHKHFPTRQSYYWLATCNWKSSLHDNVSCCSRFSSFEVFPHHKAAQLVT